MAAVIALNCEQKRLCQPQACRSPRADGVRAQRAKKSAQGSRDGTTSCGGRRFKGAAHQSISSHAGDGWAGLISNVSFSLEQFIAVLGACEEIGHPHVLIGGQAVYFWATRYVDEETSLEQLRPFTSSDIDFHGGRTDVLRLAEKLGRRAEFPPAHVLTSLVGMIPLTIGNARSSVEFVRQVAGVKAGDISKFAVEREFNGTKIRVLDPISLMIGKTNLALTVDQKQRRDVDHLRIMVVCTRAFLRETLAGVEAGELPARGWLGAVERVLKLAESADGKKAARKLRVVWREALPEKEIATSEHRLVAQFRRVRLPHWLEKQK